jgi:hypothetical protein
VSDKELMEEAFKHCRMYFKLQRSQDSLGCAIEAHMRGKGDACWHHLIEWASMLDEGMDMLMDAVKR